MHSSNISEIPILTIKFKTILKTLETNLLSFRDWHNISTSFYKNSWICAFDLSINMQYIGALQIESSHYLHASNVNRTTFNIQETILPVVLP